jgi:hypothetical protein
MEGFNFEANNKLHIWMEVNGEREQMDDKSVNEDYY